MFSASLYVICFVNKDFFHLEVAKYFTYYSSNLLDAGIWELYSTPHSLHFPVNSKRDVTLIHSKGVTVYDGSITTAIVMQYYYNHYSAENTV